VALIVPQAMDSNGSMLVLLVNAIANPGAPTIAEVTAGTVVDLSCYLTADGFTTGITENTVEDTRLCTKQVLEIPGDFTETLEISYVYNNLDEDEDEARIGLTAGVTKFIVARYGVDPEDAISVADIVDVFGFRAGKGRKNTPGRNSVHTITQKLFLNDITRHDVAIVA
jgi:hypothetical protein